MLVLNFSHPLTPAQRAAIEDDVRAEHGQVEFREVMVQYDMTQPLAPQAETYFDALLPEGYHPNVAVRFPAMAGETMLAVALGRLGYLPGQVVIRAQRGLVTQEYVYSHIEELNDVRMRTEAK